MLSYEYIIILTLAYASLTFARACLLVTLRRQKQIDNTNEACCMPGALHTALLWHFEVL